MMKVSVVIPTYNYSCFIREAVESALNQTCPPYEVIVIDDGSTDNTAEILKHYIDTGRIRYHYQMNSGLCAARNVGLSLATGSAFALLDSDDSWHPQKLECQIAYLETNPACELVGTEAFSQERGMWATIGSLTVNALPLETHLLRTRFCPSSALFRRSLWEQVGGFDQAAGGTADRDYWIRCAAVSVVARIELPLTFYRIHNGSMTATKVDAMIASERAVLDKSFISLSTIRGRMLLKRRAYAMAHLSAAYTLWRDAKRPRAASGQFFRSLLSWPLPLSRSDTNIPFYRLRFGARLLIAALRG
ncbi:Glycosyl transferase OS=Singulisphaera acidiphila (strain ATCC BAA-1392 / DSM 18658 / VKM B-2454 / MOB10) GN=Sinac_2482 PE=4 SV=1: Glycos_transf_2 [Gemmata massiliana]|uniref:Glycosyltransferase 2-like domain-containing protein n=1 Tax=Gemmata massiliana TaxID=1210884 RepID=A0A6P2D5I5_9BACT|nr:glycosyltransferase family A protein [Gemmata massiliana]VTR95705.1 Glycosyl transferase OS=Singulisphaera acidiphila (strain ATCC BAA-1392 / DSM 18658 / VKM B-2454 / MOB10) GN=Sinac_2482 PE=4 SV=1: Glycos_transf_2 [Gemmata massiliana]